MIEDVRDITSFKWATVTAIAPLAIKLDGDTTALALIPDSLVDPTTLSVNDRVRVELSLRKVVIHGVSNGRDGFGPGDIITTAAAVARQGFMMCRGQSLLRTEYPRLFQAIGTAYGAPDASRFNIPWMAGKVVVGYDAAQAEFNTLGKQGGATTHTLSTDEMPSHAHRTGISPTSAMAGSAGGFSAIVTFTQNQSQSEFVGGGAAHNNLQPYITLNYMIKL